MYSHIFSSYQYHSNVVGANDFLNKLRVFAVANGWTQQYYSPEGIWEDQGGGYYDWTDYQGDDQDHLGLYSNGYGGQDLCFRFSSGNWSQYPAYDIVDVNCQKPLYSTLDHASSVYPDYNHITYIWNSINYGYCFTTPPGTFPGVWFFGNKYFIGVELQLSSEVVATFMFGTFQQLPEVTSLYPNELNIFHPCYYSFKSQYTQWDDSNSKVAGTGYMGYANTPVILIDGSGKYSNCYKPNMSSWLNAKCTGIFNKYTNCDCINNFSNRRMLIKPNMFLYQSSIDVWYPAGSLPVYYLKTEGLEIAEVLRFGGEEYMCFPNTKKSFSYGHAWRIL